METSKYLSARCTCSSHFTSLAISLQFWVLACDVRMFFLPTWRLMLNKTVPFRRSHLDACQPLLVPGWCRPTRCTHFALAEPNTLCGRRLNTDRGCRCCGPRPVSRHGGIQITLIRGNNLPPRPDRIIIYKMDHFPALVCAVLFGRPHVCM